MKIINLIIDKCKKILIFRKHFQRYFANAVENNVTCKKTTITALFIICTYRCRFIRFMQC